MLRTILQGFIAFLKREDELLKYFCSRCLLFTLLFALLIEPFAQLIRFDPDVRGIELGGHQHKVCLFVDDILIFLSYPYTSAPNLLSLLESFA